MRIPMRSAALACCGACAIWVGVGPRGGFERRAQWMPDTATILYTSTESRNADLFRRRGVEGEPRNLTRHAAQDHRGRWSPDGRRIAFQSTRDGQREIYVMAADGAGEPVNVTRHPDEDLLPEWSPDGERLLFFSTRGQARGPRGEFVGHLYVMRADGNDVVRLTGDPLTSSFAGSWSPDGRRLVFARDVGGNIEVFALDVDSRRERRLTNREGADYGARYAPDGARIAFHTGVGEESRIAVMDADGSGRRTLTEGALHYDPVWSPDGRWLAFTGAPLGATRYDVLMVPAQGGAVAPLVATDADERSGVWAPVAN